MSLYTISLMGLLDAYLLNPKDSLDNISTQYRVANGRKILLSNNVQLPSGKNANEFIDRFIRAFIIQNLYEDIIYDSCERWLLRFQSECEIKLPLYIAKYDAMKRLQESDLEYIGKTINESDSTSDSKNLGSQFPQNIASAKEFDDVKFMDTGSMSTSKNTGKGTTKAYSNILDRLDSYAKQQMNYIQECVDSFNNLFMGVY